MMGTLRQIKITKIEQGNASPYVAEAMAPLLGQTVQLGQAIAKLREATSQAPVFAIEPCNCGAPGCLGRDGPVIGYFDGRLDEEGNPQGTWHPVIVFELIEDPAMETTGRDGGIGIGVVKDRIFITLEVPGGTTSVKFDIEDARYIIVGLQRAIAIMRGGMDVAAN